jgi:hypothetical protein
MPIVVLNCVTIKYVCLYIFQTFMSQELECKKLELEDLKREKVLSLIIFIIYMYRPYSTWENLILQIYNTSSPRLY